VADSHQLQEYLKNPGKFSPENKKIQSTIFPIQENFRLVGQEFTQ